MYFGGLPVQLALWISFWSIVSIVICMKVVKKMVDRLNRPSIVVIIVAICLGLSAIMVPLYDVRNLIEAYRGGCNIWNFNSIC